jgi:hypothetical protein
MAFEDAPSRLDGNRIPTAKQSADAAQPTQKAKGASKRRSRFIEKLSFYLFTKKGRKKVKAHALGLAILFLTLLQIGKWVLSEVVSLFGW